MNLSHPSISTLSICIILRTFIIFNINMLVQQKSSLILDKYFICFIQGIISLWVNIGGPQPRGILQPARREPGGGVLNFNFQWQWWGYFKIFYFMFVCYLLLFKLQFYQGPSSLTSLIHFFHGQVCDFQSAHSIVKNIYLQVKFCYLYEVK